MLSSAWVPSTYVADLDDFQFPGFNLALSLLFQASAEGTVDQRALSPLSSSVTLSNNIFRKTTAKNDLKKKVQYFQRLEKENILSVQKSTISVTQ